MVRKYKCKTCNTVWLSEYSPDEHVQEEGADHVVREIKTLSAEDYAEAWAMDLESENRHSLTDMPSIILNRLCKHISDRKVVRAIMKDLYNIGLGMG